MDNNNIKNKYRQLCNQSNSIPLFSRDWWLDAVSGIDDWDVVAVESDNKIVAAHPYFKVRRLGFDVASMPPLTKILGPWTEQPKGKYARQLSRRFDLINQLLDQLPEFGQYISNWHYDQDNWLPFYWNGYQQTTRYSYVIENIRDTQAVWDGFLEKVKTDIRKSENRYKLRIRDDLSIDDLIDLGNLTFERQGLKANFDRQLLHSIDRACAARQQRKIFIAEDEKGQRHAGVYIVWDQNSTYYLFGGGDPKLRNSGAASHCIWHAINFASTVTQSFDFLGSVIKPIELFFRGFGAIQKPYFTVYRTKSPILKLADFSTQVLRKIKL
jgi:hypothetical protein